MIRFILLALLLPTIVAGNTINCTSSDPANCNVATSNTNLVGGNKNIENRAGFAPITFSEFAIDTDISTQYIAKGIIFGNNNAVYITDDNSNPTAPVLSGKPRFRGPVTGQFVIPNTNTPTIVESFSLDAGYFDRIGSTRLIVYDTENKIITQQTNSILKIQNFVISGGGITRFRFEIFEEEPNGFAIDNFISQQVQSSLVFRDSVAGQRLWQYDPSTPIPGFDHVGLNVDDVMYESHPGYFNGTYRGSAPTTPTKIIVSENGVQNQMTRLLFLHNSRNATTPTVVQSEIPITPDLAQRMRTAILTKTNAGYLAPNYEDIFGNFTSNNQKGAGGQFTSVGLVEWAAEQAGHSNGQGFVPNVLESAAIRSGAYPLLTPELLHFCARSPTACFNQAIVYGFVDPVDYLISDPFGRRLGFTRATGLINEIPGAFLTTDGALEQFIIPAVVPGPWTMEYIGLGQDARGVILFTTQTQVLASTEFEGFINSSAAVATNGLTVPIVAGTRGDVNGDRAVNQADVTIVRARIGQFTEGLFDPADLTGDGKIKQDDVDALLKLIDILKPKSPVAPKVPTVAPAPTTKRPTMAPVPTTQRPTMTPVTTSPTVVPAPIAPTTTTTRNPTTATTPTARPVLPPFPRGPLCGCFGLGIFCLGGCGLVQRLFGLC